MTKGLVLVTGATGFVGTEVSRQLIDAGYSVRGTSRSHEKIKDWEEFNPEYKSKMTWAIVEDLVIPGAFDSAIKGVKYVAHAASPYHFKFTDNEKEMLIPAISGTKSVLAAAKSESTVEHVIITSSFAAVSDLSLAPRPGYKYTAKDYNPATYEEAAQSKNPGFVYCASKVLAEKAAWDEKDRKFALTTFCPPVIFGPPRQAITSTQGINTSSSRVWGIINATPSTPIAPTAFPIGVDVRDLAALHVRALEAKEQSADKRFLVIAWHIFHYEISDIIRQYYAKDESKLGRIANGGGDAYYDHYSTDSGETEKLLGRPFISKEKSVIDSTERLYEIEAYLKATGRQ